MCAQLVTLIPHTIQLGLAQPSLVHNQVETTNKQFPWGAQDGLSRSLQSCKVLGRHQAKASPYIIRPLDRLSRLALPEVARAFH